MPERLPPEDPREWLNRARSNVLLAQAQREGIYLEDLCFNAQQAVEKAIKAVLMQRAVEFPYVHDGFDHGVGHPAKTLDPVGCFAYHATYPRSSCRSMACTPARRP